MTSSYPTVSAQLRSRCCLLITHSFKLQYTMAFISQLTRSCSRQQSCFGALHPHASTWISRERNGFQYSWTVKRNASCFSTSTSFLASSIGGSTQTRMTRAKHETIPLTCLFSSSTSNEEDDTDMLAQRIQHLQMNPDSLAKDILPGNVVKRVNKKTGKERMIYTERAFGYFWMMKDLEKTKNKPILSNPTLIPESQAQLFPSLDNLITLTDETVSLPQFFQQTNRTKDPAAQCTLVAISFRDFGFKLLPSWLQPFEDAFQNENNKRINIIRISIMEGWIIGTLLKGLITRNLKQNTPTSLHARTLLKYGDSTDFIDALRMHNTMTGYIFLLDGLGRVRFGASGGASEKEVDDLIKMTRTLLKAPFSNERNERKSNKMKRGRDFQRR